MNITPSQIKASLGVTESYDIINAIRNSNPSFAQYVPLADADNIAEVGAGILINQTVQNEFITALVDRIGLVVIKQASLENPLKKFKKGMMPQGLTIEEIFTDITKGKKYNAKDAEQTVFKRSIPDVHTLFHRRNRQDFYEQTIQGESLASAFVSWGNFDGFIASIINSIYNSAEVEEFLYMKLLIDNYQAKGMFKVVNVPSPTGELAAKQFMKHVRATATKMTLPSGSRDFNALAVHTRTSWEDLHLIVTADLMAEIDVEVLARAFNMSKTDFIGSVTIVDSFATPGLEAVMVDREWFMVYDTLMKMETIRNPKGLYWNYFFHVWQVMSVSRFANAVAFMSSDIPDISQVIVSPSIAEISALETFQFDAVVRANNDTQYTLAWTVESIDGAPTAAIDEDGVFTATALTGKYKVIATATYDTDKTVTGEALITVS